MAGVRIFVCVSCRSGDDAESRPGARLIEQLSASAAARGIDLDIEAVECLAVCKRPATIALGAPGKWSYVIGDIDPGVHVDETIDAALAYAESDSGVVPWKERPASFRKGVVSRIPPIQGSPVEA